MSRRDPPVPLPETDDPYVLLDVRPGANADQIRRAYLRRVKVYKPDRHPAEFRRVREAYDRLREQEAWFDAWRQASEVVRQAIEESEKEASTAANETVGADGSAGAGETVGADGSAGAGETVGADGIGAERVAEAEASKWERIEAAQREADAEIEAEVEREAQAQQQRDRGWGGEPVHLGDHRVTDDLHEDDRRRRAAHAVTVGARLGDLASAVHDELEEGRGAEAAALLLDEDAETLAPQPAFATLLLEVCCAVVWTDPDRYDELVARYGDLVVGHDMEHRDGALLHRRTVADELPAWHTAVADWPELRRFVELGSSLRAPAEAELGLRLGQRAAADASGFLAMLSRAALAAPGIVGLYVGMAERWSRHYGQPLPGARPLGDVPTVDEGAEAIAHLLRTDRRVRWLQLRPPLAVSLLIGLLLVVRSTLAELLVLGVFLALWSWGAWGGDRLERLYLQVVQPEAGRWLWTTGATPEALAAALQARLPASRSLAAMLHPVDITGHARLIANDLALQAFAVTGPMIPRLVKRNRR